MSEFIKNKLDKKIILKLVYVAVIAIAAVILHGLIDESSHIRFKLLSLLFLFLAAVVPFVSKKVWDFGSKYLLIPFMLLYPAMCFFVTETAFMSKFYLAEGVDTGIVLSCNYILYGIIVWGVFVITYSARWAFFIPALFCTTFGMVNYYVYKFRQVPFLLGDFFKFDAAANVASGYSYNISWRQFMTLSFFLLSISVVIFARSTKITDTDKVKKRLRIRLVLAAVYIAMTVGVYNFLIGTNYLKDHGIYLKMNRPMISYTKFGGLLSMVCNLKVFSPEKPDGYDASVVKEVEQQYSSDSVTDTDKNRPNMIVIMDEAYADIQDVGDFKTDTEVMPFYESLTDNTIKGKLYVSAYKGDTANTEYEFLSGDSMGFLPASTSPYQLYIRKFFPTLTRNLTLDNYSGILAMHPYLPNGYNRQAVYAMMGFSDFISEEDYPEDAFRIGEHISDEADFDRIISEYEKAKEQSDEPFYIFNVTMQNHSPYTEDRVNLEEAVNVLDDNFSDDEVKQYLNLIHASDAALGKLVNYFENTDDPTVIVFFGDHQPGINGGIYKKLLGTDVEALDGKDRYQIYYSKYLVWANFDFDETAFAPKTEFSVNYLQAYILNMFGMKMSGYSKFLIDLMEDVPIINTYGYVGADGNYYTIDDTSSPYYDKVKLYNILCYNHLIDIDNRVNSFFELKAE